MEMFCLAQHKQQVQAHTQTAFISLANKKEKMEKQAKKMGSKGRNASHRESSI